MYALSDVNTLSLQSIFQCVLQFAHLLSRHTTYSTKKTVPEVRISGDGYSLHSVSIGKVTLVLQV